MAPSKQPRSPSYERFRHLAAPSATPGEAAAGPARVLGLQVTATFPKPIWLDQLRQAVAC
jgi:hypothetical protein